MPTTVAYWIWRNCHWIKTVSSYATWKAMPRAVVGAGCKAGPLIVAGGLLGMTPAARLPVAAAPPAVISPYIPAQPDQGASPPAGSDLYYPPGSPGYGDDFAPSGFGGGGGFLPAGGGGFIPSGPAPNIGTDCCATVPPPGGQTTTVTPPPGTKVPEPSSIALLATATCCVLFRRRRNKCR